MAPIDSKKTLKNLKKKGFFQAKSKSVDHNWIEFWYDGKLTRVKTKISHGEKALKEYLISCMYNQRYLSKNKFRDLALCPMSQDKYESILRNKGYI